MDPVNESCLQLELWNRTNDSPAPLYSYVVMPTVLNGLRPSGIWFNDFLTHGSGYIILFVNSSYLQRWDGFISRKSHIEVHLKTACQLDSTFSAGMNSLVMGVGDSRALQLSVIEQLSLSMQHIRWIIKQRVSIDTCVSLNQFSLLFELLICKEPIVWEGILLQDLIDKIPLWAKSNEFIFEIKEWLVTVIELGIGILCIFVFQSHTLCKSVSP